MNYFELGFRLIERLRATRKYAIAGELLARIFRAWCRPESNMIGSLGCLRLL